MKFFSNGLLLFFPDIENAYWIKLEDQNFWGNHPDMNTSRKNGWIDAFDPRNILF